MIIWEEILGKKACKLKPFIPIYPLNTTSSCSRKENKKINLYKEPNSPKIKWADTSVYQKKKKKFALNSFVCPCFEMSYELAHHSSAALCAPKGLKRGKVQGNSANLQNPSSFCWEQTCVSSSGVNSLIVRLQQAKAVQCRMIQGFVSCYLCFHPQFKSGYWWQKQ